MLIKKLNNAGFGPKAVKKFGNLINRNQSVYAECDKSGVPQGSFKQMMWANKISAKIHLYADDIIIFTHALSVGNAIQEL